MLSDTSQMRATFVMEQHLGHYTYYQNLRHFIEADGNRDHLQANWVKVTYKDPASLWYYTPLPGRIKGPLIGRQQIHNGLRPPHQVTFFNTQVPAALVGREVLHRPYVVSTDITPIQYDQMGRYYNHIPDRAEPISRFKRLVNLDVFQGAARVLAWSSWVGESLTNDYGVPPERVEVVPPGVNLDLWLPERNGRHGEPRPLKILFVGGDFQRKGGDLLLEAFDQLPPGSAELVLVTRSRVRSRPGVTIHSNLWPNDPALRDLYRTADVFALPSRAEAFGIAAIEAGAMALPVIAARTGGLSDIVVDRQTGLLVPPGDPEALAEALRYMAAHPEHRRQMGDAARQRVETCFNARINAARILQILEDIIQSNA